MHFKRFLAASVSVVLSAQVLLGANVAFAASYTDVSTGAWYEGVANKWGYLLTDGDTLDPEAPVTRAEFAHAINSIMGFAAANPKFSDVTSGTPYRQDIGALQAAGIVQGDENGTYNPAATIKRSEAAVIFARAFGLEAQGTPAFSDAAVIPGWVAPYANTLAEGGYFKGDQNKAFDPEGLLTRSQVFQVIENAASNYVDSAEPVTKVVNGNMIISAANAVIKDVDIKGDVIIAPSVGNGDVTFENVKLSGSLYVRGGGENSIKLTGNTTMQRVIANKSGDGGVRVVTEGNATVQDVVVKGSSSDNVKLEGKFNTVQMQSATAKLEINAEVKNVNIDAPNAKVTVGETAVIGNLFASQNSAGAAVDISGKIDNVQNAAPASTFKADEKAVIGELGVAGAAVGAVLENKGTIVILVIKSADAEVANTGKITESSAPVTVIVIGNAAEVTIVIEAGSINDVYTK